MRKAGPARIRIRLVHRGSAAAEAGHRLLVAAGYEVDCRSIDGPAALRRLRADPPAVLVIDLERAPSHGRDVGVAARHAKATRRVPIVFAGGAPETVDRVREVLPDAMFTSWRGIRGAVKRSLARSAPAPSVPKSLLAAYSGRPLLQKLGIKSESVLALLQAPPGFDKTLGPLPAGVKVRRQARGACDRIIWFTKSRRELERRVEAVAARLADKGGLWIAWRKKTSGVAADLTQNDVRRIGLAAGLVDYKICAIDETWSGLLFARRKA